jgi:hypothetical protein
VWAIPDTAHPDSEVGGGPSPPCIPSVHDSETVSHPLGFDCSSEETIVSAISQSVELLPQPNPESHSPPTASREGLTDSQFETLNKVVSGTTHLSSEQQHRLFDTLAPFADVLMSEKLGCVVSPKFHINVNGHSGVKQTMRRVGPAVEAVIEKEVRDMLDRGWIRPSESPWSSRLVLVPKPDGTIRTCVDFRRVNELTVTDAYPSPMVEDVIDCLSGAIFFTTFDAEKGYYQLLMDEQSIPITAFSCHLGLFEFIRMAFGLKNAGAFFQRMMDNTFSDFIRKFLKQFVDDTLIYSKSFDEHLIHIGLVLDRMRSIHITAKLSKCTFAAPSIKFVGFIISADGRRKDPEKISAISNILPPRTKKELRQFLGFTGYLRIFIKGYAQIARPLMLLTRDEVKNEEVEKRWTTDHQVAFDQLKKSVTEDVVLAHPDYSQPFIIETDASDFAVGVVIGQMHEDTVHNRSIIRPIAFGSAALTTAQQRYTATE